jgi:hypothetical protein
MSTQVIVEETPKLEMVELRKLDYGQAFQLDDDIGFRGNSACESGAMQVSGFNVQWTASVEISITPEWLVSSTLVHPRFDIDVLLARINLHKEPEAERAALENVTCDVGYLVDGRLGFVYQSHYNMDGPNTKLEYVEFLMVGGENIQIYSDDTEQHTIEAANVEITARRIPKENENA